MAANWRFSDPARGSGISIVTVKAPGCFCIFRPGDGEIRPALPVVIDSYHFHGDNGTGIIHRNPEFKNRADRANLSKVRVRDLDRSAPREAHRQGAFWRLDRRVSGPATVRGELRNWKSTGTGRHPPIMAPEFWETKTLEDMSPDEWEAVCDRCGLCCLEKFEDPDDGTVHTTSLACPFFEIGRCACLIYENRDGLHPDCIRLTPQNLPQLGWLPESCSYRLLAGGRQLPPWHHLVCGDPSAVHRAGMSVKNKAVNGRFADPSDLLAAVIDAWPPKP